MTTTPDLAYLLELIQRQQAIIASYERVCQSMLRTGSVQMSEAASFYDRVEALERDLILSALAHTDGNVSLAARELQMIRKTMYNKIRQYHLETHTNVRHRTPKLHLAAV